MFDFSMFIELHFLLMSLATIILFIWLIVPYFCLAEYVTRHGYSEVEASFILSIIGIANCIGMVGVRVMEVKPFKSTKKVLFDAQNLWISNYRSDWVGLVTNLGSM